MRGFFTSGCPIGHWAAITWSFCSHSMNMWLGCYFGKIKVRRHEWMIRIHGQDMRSINVIDPSDFNRSVWLCDNSRPREWGNRSSFGFSFIGIDCCFIKKLYRKDLLCSFHHFYFIIIKPLIWHGVRIQTWRTC